MKRIISLRNLLFFISITLFYTISHLIFNRVFLTSELIIDEEFHLPQGLQYCNFIFDKWNPKITTLPGLYLVTSLFLGPLGLCSTYYLRYINLVASVLNFCLFYVCFGFHNQRKGFPIRLLNAVNVSLLPPLYFFGFLYYTDVISITFIILLMIFNKKGQHFVASFFGLLSVIMRQTNIIWVVMVFATYVIRELVALLKTKEGRKLNENDISFDDLLFTIRDSIDFKFLQKFSATTWVNIAAYVSVLVTFLAFVVMNGSIVVGDKDAHTASIHLPQLFYFSLFLLIFAWPHVITHLRDFLAYFFKNMLFSLVIQVAFALAIHFNTLVHPYLVADNRHYLFYIWNRFYGKYVWFRYAMIPAYYFGLFVLFSLLRTNSNASFVMMYAICTILVLVLQKMIEIRYFLIPYVLFRLQVRDLKLWQLLCEFCFFVCINYVTLNLFFVKAIYWSDFNYVQRLIW